MSDLNAYLGVSMGFLFTSMGTSFASVRAAELIDTGAASYLPLVMAGVLGVYGLVISVITTVNFTEGSIPENAPLGACLVSGFANLFSGVAMAYICPKASEINKGLLIALMFAESIGLSGLILGLIMIN